MKAFIWISTFLVLIFANTLVIFAGGLALNYCWIFLIAAGVASGLCRVWDKHRQKKESLEDIYTPSKPNSAFAESNVIESVLSKSTTFNDSRYFEHRVAESDTKSKKRSLPKFAMPLFILSLIIVFLIFSNIILFFLNQTHITEIENLDNEISAKDKKINSLEYEISELEKLEDDALAYKEICTLLTYGNDNIGYASEKFKADKGVIILSESGSAGKIELTTKYSGDCNDSIDTSSNAALVSFDEDTWYDSTTTLTVEPQYEGVCVATFSNDVNLDTFKVLIIVTEPENSYSFQKGFDPDIYWQ